MASYEGNRLPAPGFYAGTATVPVEILYSEVNLFQKGGTLEPGKGVVPEGAALKFNSGTNRYERAAAADTIDGFNRYAVDTGSDTTGKSGLFQAIIVLGGKLKANKLTVKDAVDATLNTAIDGAATATDLKGRYIASREVLEF